MSLAWRILLFALLLNAVTVGIVQVVVYTSYQRWFTDQRAALKESVDESIADLERIYAPQRLGDTRQVRALVLSPTIHDAYEDVVVTSGRPGYETQIYLNPRGAVHRDPDHFPHGAILAAMAQSREVSGRKPVAGGYCLAVRRLEEIAGYIWFVPRHPEYLPTELPLWSSVVGVAAATLLFGMVLFLVIRRTVGEPLKTLHRAASEVAAGSYAVRLEEPDGGGEIGPVIAAFNDMAARVESHTTTLERAVREAVEQAKQKERALVLSSRLASIGTLAAGVAHEINNPIGGMQNAVNRLLQNPDLAEKQRVYLHLVLDGLQRIARTTRRLLDFSPRQKAAGTFAIGTAIEGAKALVEHRVQRHAITLVVDVAPGLPQLRGDAHEIQQVVLNLLLNSLDALEQRGGPGRITVRAAVEGGKVGLHVDDDGPGMDPQDLGSVFDPFFTKKERPDASGLGMFISYSIVQSHGGEITADSRPGEGFRVHIVLPQAPPA